MIPQNSTLPESFRMQLSPVQAYFNLADSLFRREIHEAQLFQQVKNLPALDPSLLQALAQMIDAFCWKEPRRAWALARVTASAACLPPCDELSRSLAYWYLGKACNAWVQPEKAARAIAKARRGFEALHKQGWLAACQWQANALSWTKPDFTLAAISLQQALADLESTRFTDFSPHCRLALADTQMMIGQFDAAAENIQICQAQFLAQGDILNQTRCSLSEAGRLRRMGQYDEAICLLGKAKAIFTEQELPLDLNRVIYHIAMVYLVTTDQLPQAVDFFLQAAETYQKYDMDLWKAVCLTNLASIYVQTGQLSAADQAFAQSRKSFSRHHINYMLATNLNDHGLLNTIRGLSAESIPQFKQALAIYQDLGAELYASLCMANLGAAYGMGERYQEALHYLEEASTQLKKFNNYHRMGDCEYYLGILWSRLKQPGQAQQCFNLALEDYQQAHLPGQLSQVYITRAGILFNLGKPEEAQADLQKSLKIAKEHHLKPMIARALRILGSGYIKLKCYQEALSSLETALSSAAEMGLVFEEAACSLAIATCHAHISLPDQAHQAYQEVLALSLGSFSEIDFLAFNGLGELAESDRNENEALEYYRLAEKALAKVRLDIWQPALAGTYLQEPSIILHHYVTLATHLGNTVAALEFIEANKATSLLVQLQTLHTPKAGRNKAEKELEEMKAELTWLQDQARLSSESDHPLQAWPSSQAYRQQLAEKLKNYNDQLAKVERKELLGHHQPSTATFDIDRFRTFAQSFNHPWIVLDYYLLDHELITVALGDSFLELFHTDITAHIRLALDECAKSRQAGQFPLQEDLDVLGHFLIPAGLLSRLQADMLCIIAPHRQLHSIPWAALPCGQANQPLVTLCNLLLTPSVNNLTALLQRVKTETRAETSQGLVIGLSHFQGRHPDLPAVETEIEHLASACPTPAEVVQNADATWPKLQALAKEGKLADAAWLHVASHMFFDPLTGRMSGLALWDGDIWLDQFRDLAPLPALVTFSACNSLQGRVYDGDEPIGIAVTCLVAGADHVVGNIWAVADIAAADFMVQFYEAFLAGASPVEAVAYTQRQMIARKEPFSSWAGFQCLGLP